MSDVELRELERQWAVDPPESPEDAYHARMRLGSVHDAWLGLAEAGIVGMEVHYAQYSRDTVQQLAGLATRYGLIACGGSDYHGLGNEGEPLPGTLGPPLETVELLEQAAEKIAADTGKPARVSA